MSLERENHGVTLSLLRKISVQAGDDLNESAVFEWAGQSGVKKLHICISGC